MKLFIILVKVMLLFGKILIKIFLFNGNYISNNSEFDQYLKRHGYVFKNENKELAGYAILKNKRIILTMDIGE